MILPTLATQGTPLKTYGPVWGKTKITILVVSLAYSPSSMFMLPHLYALDFWAIKYCSLFASQSRHYKYSGFLVSKSELELGWQLLEWFLSLSRPKNRFLAQQQEQTDLSPGIVVVFLDQDRGVIQVNYKRIGKPLRL